MAFERVFSWLDLNLDLPAILLAGAVSANLIQWSVASPFSSAAFRNFNGFLAKIEAVSDSLSARLKIQLSRVTLSALAGYNSATGAGPDFLMTDLVPALNRILGKPGSIIRSRW